MYTPTGSFFEVVSFLEGLGAGSGIEGNNYHSKFTPFLKWMARRLNKNERFPISWQEFADVYSSESETIGALPGLYEEYLNDDKHI
jgi:hypothetical protein